MQRLLPVGLTEHQASVGQDLPFATREIHVVQLPVSAALPPFGFNAPSVIEGIWRPGMRSIAPGQSQNSCLSFYRSPPPAPTFAFDWYFYG